MSPAIPTSKARRSFGFGPFLWLQVPHFSLRLRGDTVPLSKHNKFPGPNHRPSVELVNPQGIDIGAVFEGVDFGKDTLLLETDFLLNGTASSFNLQSLTVLGQANGGTLPREPNSDNFLPVSRDGGLRSFFLGDSPVFPNFVD